MAGLRAAIQPSRAGRVLMLTKGHPLESNSMYAQGGVAVALSEEDDVGSHLTDTLKAGHGLCRREVVRVLVEEGPERIQAAILMGRKVRQNRKEVCVHARSGAQQKPYLACSWRCHGNEMVRALMTHAARQPRIQRLDRRFTVDLAVIDGRCCGAIVLNELSGERTALPASAVVLSTGGAGQVYARTTNPR